MKTRTRSLAFGLFLGVMLLCCMGIVYIDTTNNYWNFSGGFIRLIVNTNSQASITVDTNTLGFGINTNNNTQAIMLQARPRTTNATGNGVNASLVGRITIKSGKGGGTFATTTASGGTAGAVNLFSGEGGDVPLAQTNATGGAGGQLDITAGNGGMDGIVGAATNNVTGGNGGSAGITSGNGGSPATPATNAVGGAGGNFVFTGGSGGSPTAGWARKGGNGGSFSFSGGAGGTGVRTNGGNGGSLSLSGGTAGSAATDNAPAGAAGVLSIIGGDGGTGTGTGTNSDGGSVFLRGGTPGSGAVPGNVIVGRNSIGTGNGGGLMVGISNSAIVTNIVFVRTNLDFPQVSSQCSTDLVAIAITGRTNAIVTVGVPPSALAANISWSGFCSNGVVFVRANNYSAGNIDPGIGDFEVEVRAHR